MAKVTNGICMVRVGGGWERLEEYIEKKEKDELNKLSYLMEHDNKCFEQVIHDLLVKYNADIEVQERYSKLIPKVSKALKGKVQKKLAENEA